MGLQLLWGVTTLFMVVPATVYGASLAECRDRYFLISTDLNLIGNYSWFEVVVALECTKSLMFEATNHSCLDNGVHKLEANYAAECGYTLSNFNPKGVLILRVSYFACHVENKGDAEFTLRYQIVKLDERGKRTTHTSEISCKLDRDWKPREVLCEENYMEVSVRQNISRLSQCAATKNWDVVPSGDKRLSEWQVLIKRSNDEPVSLSVEEARSQGYIVTSTPHRIVFRSPYNKTLTEIKMVDGIEVETISVTAVFRQNWVLVMIETVPACAINPGTFNGSHLAWTVPRIMEPLAQSSSNFEDKALLMGVNGQVVDSATMNALDYRLDIFGSYLTVSVPLWAVGGVYESRVINNQCNSRYTTQLYLQHLWADDMFEETEHRSFRLVGTPYIVRRSFTIDQTILEEHTFTVYLGNFPYDVDLTAVDLNGEPFTVAEAIQSGYPITNVPHSNGTHAYVIRVPFEHSIVPKLHLGEGILQFSLDINYTLNIMPQENPYYHSASITAQHNDYFLPVLNGLCTEKGILFRMDHKKLGYLWEFSIGDYLLTPELAAQHGYILLNDSQKLTLEVPLFTTGYIYEDINLRQFFGTFEIVSRDRRTWTIAEMLAKRCPFKTTQLTVCAPGGVVTVVTSIITTLPTVNPWQTTLLDKACKPKDSDETRVLFTFHVNTCGTRVMVNGNYLTYENEVVFNRDIIPAHQPVISRNSEFRRTVHCYYPINDTVRLHTDRKFLEEPKVAGVGSIIETFRKEHGQSDVSSIHNGIVRGSASEDLEILNKEEYNSTFPYVPVVGVAVALLGTLLAALIKMRC